MRAFTSSVIIGSISTKVDGGLSVRMILPELTPDQKTAVFELQNCELKMLLQQEGDNPAKYTEVKGEFQNKSQSERLYNTLFVLWKEIDGTGDFQDFRRREMEKIISKIKEKFPERTT